MSAHHDDHHISEQKPVSFTVPLILASVTVLIIVLVLSVCDPKSGHATHQENHPNLEKHHAAGDNTGTQHTTDENAPEAAGANEAHH